MNNIDNIGKIPPQCIDIEEMIIGALLLEGKAIERINIKPAYFYKQSHQEIFEAIQTLENKNNPIDSITVCDQLRTMNKLDEVGGVVYITNLSLKVASTAHIEYHSMILEDKFIKRELIRISFEIQKLAFDDFIDTLDVMEFANNEIDKLSTLSEVSEIKDFSEVIKQSIKNLELRQKLYEQGKSCGIETPIRRLTKWTGGWQKKQLIVIAARPSMGKTALALAIARTAAEAKSTPAIFSLEMDSVDMVDRILIGASGVNADAYKLGAMTPESWKQIEASYSKIGSLPILIEDKPLTINQIRSKVRSLKRKKKCDLVIIDYLQLMSIDDKNRNREQEIATISRKCKLLSVELDIPVILLSQLNRKVDERASKRPQLSDLRESGAIEQDADMVLFILRPEYYGLTEDENGEPYNGKSIIILDKHSNGKTGDIPFRFNESVTEVYDWDSVYSPIQNVDVNSRIEPNKDFEKEKTPF
jgi:replicative DNA helicase